MPNYQQIGQNNQLYVAPGAQSNKLTIPFNNGVVFFFHLFANYCYSDSL
jgi:hypothetical protein